MAAKKLPALKRTRERVGLLATVLLQSSDVRCTFDCDPAIAVSKQIAVSTARHLLLIAREACTNSLRHGGAKNLELKLSLEGPLVVLRIADDGVGLGSELRADLGLRIMRNRPRIIQGRLSFGRATPHGTVITCTFAREVVDEEERHKSVGRESADRR